MLPGHDPVFSGRTAYRALIPAEKLSPDHPSRSQSVMYTGKQKHIVTYLVSNSQLINVVAFVYHPGHAKQYPGAPVETVSQEELVSHFAEFEDQVQILLSHIPKPSRWALRTLDPLDTYISDRVALIGDAAHAMTPHLGAGAGQAIEDGFVLASLLRLPIPQALVSFDALRRSYTSNLMTNAQRQAGFYDYTSPGFEVVKKGAVGLSEDMKQRWMAAVSTQFFNWAWTPFDRSTLSEFESIYRNSTIPLDKVQPR
ncbi:hypothetical protein BDZ89DRAFT_1006507 [Hymenopellis radicata]|nr:hypothetical protein BDZ89DRAFT_1006507 [Hymenopellis radicata]